MIPIKGYTELRDLLKRIDTIDYHDSGPATDNLGKQVRIEFADEQDSGQGVTLYWNIAPDGTERWVCQD